MPEHADLTVPYDANAGPRDVVDRRRVRRHPDHARANLVLTAAAAADDAGAWLTALHRPQSVNASTTSFVMRRPPLTGAASNRDQARRVRAFTRTAFAVLSSPLRQHARAGWLLLVGRPHVLRTWAAASDAMNTDTSDALFFDVRSGCKAKHTSAIAAATLANHADAARELRHRVAASVTDAENAIYQVARQSALIRADDQDEIANEVRSVAVLTDQECRICSGRGLTRLDVVAG
jgi:hypothetical protein